MRSKIKKHNIARMTLIEVLIAMIILVIIMGFLTMIFSKVQILTRKDSRRTDIYNQQRLFFDIMSRDLESIVVASEDTVEGDQEIGINCVFISNSGFAFMTTSRIGFTDTDTSLLLEVKYEYDSAKGEITRHYTSQKHLGLWNYKTEKEFYKTMGDNTVILEGVREFTLIPYDINGNALSSVYDSWVLPAYVEFKMTVVPPELDDDTSNTENQFRYSFSKIIYFPNGELD